VTQIEEFLRGDEPFMIKKRTPEELADYDAGFKAAMEGEGWDDAQSFAWQCGYGEAQE
jgi:hypothetical protein